MNTKVLSGFPAKFDPVGAAVHRLPHHLLPPRHLLPSRPLLCLSAHPPQSRRRRELPHLCRVGRSRAPANPSTICGDPQVTAMIDSFKKAILTSDGPLLSSLVSPSRGMDVAYYRDGTVITYKPEHAKFLFETTFEVDWGTEPGSGAMKRGSFHDVVLPELVQHLQPAIHAAL